MMGGQPEREPGDVRELRDVVTSSARRAAFIAAGQWDAVTLPARVANHAAEQPDRVAVIDELGERLTYAELWDQATRVAAFLVERSIGPDSVVSVQLPNRPSTVAVAVGVLAAGAVINPLLPNYRSRELTHVFETASPAAIFTPSNYRGFDHEQLVEETSAKTGVVPLHVVCDTEPSRAITFADVIKTEPESGAGVLATRRQCRS